MGIALIDYLIRLFGLGSATWISQFIFFGFPILGVLPQAHTFSRAEKLAPRPEDPIKIFDSVTERFRSRSHSKPRAADFLWGEAIEHVNRGWLGQPGELGNSGQLSLPHGVVINPVFRFSVSER